MTEEDRMITRPASELRFVFSRESLPTVDLDTDSLPFFSTLGLNVLTDLLQPLASAEPDLVATIYHYNQYSPQFENNTAYFAVAGPAHLLTTLMQGLTQSPVIKVRACEGVMPPTALPQYHLQDGRVWCPHDFLHWSARSNSAVVKAGSTANYFEEMEARDEQRRLRDQAIKRLCLHYGVSEHFMLQKLILDAQTMTVSRMNAEERRAYVAEEGAAPRESYKRREEFLAS
jgi:hypothetical protein